MSLRVLVTGGRSYPYVARVRAALTALHDGFGIGCVITGAASGADAAAETWAREHGVEVRSYPAEWKRHGPRAGPLRNQRMIDEERPDLVVAFPGGRGTADMVRRAEAAGVRVVTRGAEPDE